MKYPRPNGLNNIIFSQSWKLKVQGQGVGRAGGSSEPLIGLQMAALLLPRGLPPVSVPLGLPLGLLFCLCKI